MPDKEIKEFELKIGDLYKAWKKENQKLTLDVPKLRLEIKELESSDECKTPEGKKKLKTLQGDLKCIAEKLEKQTNKFELDLAKLPVPQQAPKKELELLPKSIEKILKKGGLELADGVVLQPKVKMDFKKFKIKEAGLKLKFEF